MKRVLLLPVFALAAVIAAPPQTAAQVPPDAAPLGLLAYNPANQHHYQLVRMPDAIEWSKAMTSSNARSFAGVTGHMVCLNDPAEQAFIDGSFFAENAWIGAYRDNAAPDFKAKTGGWKWITQEPFRYTNWKEGEPNNRDNERNAVFWSGHQWMDTPPEHKVASYMIEFPTTGPQGEASKSGSEQVAALLARVQARYRGMRTYQATLQFTSKALLQQGIGLNVNLILQAPGRFRLEGRGNNGSLVAVSDGQGFVMARTYPREPMHWMIKRSQGLQSLQEAMSLLIDAPCPPSLLGFALGTVKPTMWSTSGRLGGCRDDAPGEEMIRSRLRMQIIGNDPKDADATLIVSGKEARILSSEINYRDADLIPTTVRETHSNVRINEAVPQGAFAFQPSPNAVQVDDLGERPDEVSYTPRAR